MENTKVSKFHTEANVPVAEVSIILKFGALVNILVFRAVGDGSSRLGGRDAVFFSDGLRFLVHMTKNLELIKGSLKVGTNSSNLVLKKGRVPVRLEFILEESFSMSKLFKGVVETALKNIPFTLIELVFQVNGLLFVARSIVVKLVTGGFNAMSIGARDNEVS
ncbi:hypothetical protein SARC_11099 [Sphaeroforma arctica JP610]|uniref:Uncharacterized protein n=1 Tax=Sphaeroforma arctica JP610 TaxID=667725 RepID=A0A0L0FK20_9EUKA|nr:hypothetical protein SARC_11099 [Sphaeroforma arctica JP610]KNC76393.1 hypothetical protein SARC_11099 [Sphaeroforma arctica JP610]|eukprot:XP_014150295.1 hypothetical protein SARC_11099 [Sphaeroforma arctica JP610]